MLRSYIIEPQAILETLARWSRRTVVGLLAMMRKDRKEFDTHRQMGIISCPSWFSMVDMKSYFRG